MIIFYRKDGTIAGTIEGRIHTQDHLNMWIGEDTKRIVINWKPVKFFDKDGNEIEQDARDDKGNPLLFTADFEPDHSQKALFEDFDRKPNDPKRKNVLDYKIEPESEKLIKA